MPEACGSYVHQVNGFCTRSNTAATANVVQSAEACASYVCARSDTASGPSGCCWCLHPNCIFQMTQRRSQEELKAHTSSTHNTEAVSRSARKRAGKKAAAKQVPLKPATGPQSDSFTEPVLDLAAMAEQHERLGATGLKAALHGAATSICSPLCTINSELHGCPNPDQETTGQTMAILEVPPLNPWCCVLTAAVC